MTCNSIKISNCTGSFALTHPQSDWVWVMLSDRTCRARFIVHIQWILLNANFHLFFANGVVWSEGKSEVKASVDDWAIKVSLSFTSALRSCAFLNTFTMGTAFPRVPPRNHPYSWQSTRRWPSHKPGMGCQYHSTFWQARSYLSSRNITAK